MLLQPRFPAHYSPTLDVFGHDEERTSPFRGFWLFSFRRRLSYYSCQFLMEAKDTNNTKDEAFIRKQIKKNPDDFELLENGKVREKLRHL